MTSSTKKSLRTKMLEIVKANGWVLDTSVLNSPRYGGKYTQDPHVFLKAAAHGGLWQINLDYVIKDSWSRNVGERLQKIEIHYIAPGTETEYFTYGEYEYNRQSRGRTTEVVDNRVTVQRHVEYLNPLMLDSDSDYLRKDSAVLKNPSKYDSNHYLWDATGLDETGETFYTKGGNARTLRQRAEILVRNIDLAIWVAAELQFDSEVRSRQQQDAKRQDAIERAQAPQGVSADVDVWRVAVAELAAAASALQCADGKTTNIIELTIRAREAMAAVDNMITAWG